MSSNATNIKLQTKVQRLEGELYHLVRDSEEELKAMTLQRDGRRRSRLR